jgi:predicted phosphodiesterase
VFHVKIHCMSDLHLEHGDLKLPGGDVLVLAGDIWVAKHMLLSSDDHFIKLRGRYVRFVEEELKKYKQVLVVKGNHECYGSIIEETSEIIKDFVGRFSHRVALLDDEAAIIDGVAFIGSTMWATYGANDVLGEIRVRNSMNDCRVIRTHTEPKDGWGRLPPHSRAMLPSDFEKIHKQSRKRVLDLLKKHADKPCVLITHHAPTYASGKYDPHWGKGLDEAYYSNFLDYAVRKHKNIVAAVHGHTHIKVRFEHHGVLVVSNPRGYAGHEPMANEFDPEAGDFEITKEGKIAE